MSDPERVFQELPVPGEASTAGQAVEVFRGWIIDGRLFCSLNPKAFEGPTVWGILLADAAHHVADALHAIDGADRTESLRAVVKAFKREMQEPTASHTGEVVEKDENRKQQG